MKTCVGNWQNLCTCFQKMQKTIRFQYGWNLFMIQFMATCGWYPSLSLQMVHCGALQDKWSKTAVFLFRHISNDTQTKHDIPLCVSIGFQFRHTPMNRSYCCTVASAWTDHRKYRKIPLLVINYDHVSLVNWSKASTCVRTRQKTDRYQRWSPF